MQGKTHAPQGVAPRGAMSDNTKTRDTNPQRVGRPHPMGEPRNPWKTCVFCGKSNICSYFCNRREISVSITQNTGGSAADKAGGGGKAERIG